jgi:hypothetical protein
MPHTHRCCLWRESLILGRFHSRIGLRKETDGAKSDYSKKLWKGSRETSGYRWEFEATHINLPTVFPRLQSSLGRLTIFPSSRRLFWRDDSEGVDHKHNPISIESLEFSSLSRIEEYSRDSIQRSISPNMSHDLTHFLP